MANSTLRTDRERALRLLHLTGEVVRMFHGNSSDAARWMTTRNAALGGHTPLEIATTERGASRVTDLIGQTMRGVMS